MSRPALPEGQAATTPPERRGIARDAVRLLVARPSGVHHETFRRLAEHLRAGDVVVVNTSATRAAAIDARWRGRPVVVHLSNRLHDGDWIAEIRQPDGGGPVRQAAAGEILHLSGGSRARLISSHQGSRLWRMELRSTGTGLPARPITYDHAGHAWPLADYQTIFAIPSDPDGASAEMPSASRPFTHPMVTELVKREVVVVPLSLHTGVSSPERHETPPPEQFRVPAVTAEAVNAARRRGSRVVAAGTTVTRALETAAADDGTVVAGQGWTDLVLGPERPTRVVSGLLTGWHPADASHLLLLEAVAGFSLVERAYRAAAAAGYLWHEFGDSCLLLP